MLALIDGRRPVRQVLALAPVDEAVGMMKPGRAFPEHLAVEEGHHRPLVVVGQCRQRSDEFIQGCGVLPQLPLRLVADSHEATLVAQIVDFAEVRIHRVAQLRSAAPARPSISASGLVSLMAAKSTSSSTPLARKYRASNAFGICRKKLVDE